MTKQKRSFFVILLFFLVWGFAISEGCSNEVPGTGTEQKNEGSGDAAISILENAPNTAEKEPTLETPLVIEKETLVEAPPIDDTKEPTPAPPLSSKKKFLLRLRLSTMQKKQIP